MHLTAHLMSPPGAQKQEKYLRERNIKVIFISSVFEIISHLVHAGLEFAMVTKDDLELLNPLSLPPPPHTQAEGLQAWTTMCG